jgi:hypothetical protein
MFTPMQEPFFADFRRALVCFVILSHAIFSRMDNAFVVRFIPKQFLSGNNNPN